MQAVALFLIFAAVGLHAQTASQPRPETEPQRRATLNATDFQYKFNAAANLASNALGTINTMFVDSVPSLDTLPGNGIAQAVIALNPCAIWVPHIHPRANEILYVAQGTVKMGFQEENNGTYGSGGAPYGGRLFNFSTVPTGSSVIVPQGLAHYIWNPNCDKATILSSFDNKDPGTSSLAQTLFKLPSEVIAAATGLDALSINLVQQKVAQQALVSFDTACITTCNLPTPNLSAAGTSAEAPASSAAANVSTSG